MYYLLAREVLRLRGSIPRDQPWNVMVDMFFYRDPEEAEKEQEKKKEITENADAAWGNEPATAEWAAVPETAENPSALAPAGEWGQESSW